MLGIEVHLFSLSVIFVLFITDLVNILANMIINFDRSFLSSQSVCLFGNLSILVKQFLQLRQIKIDTASILVEFVLLFVVDREVDTLSTQLGQLI